MAARTRSASASGTNVTTLSTLSALSSSARSSSSTTTRGSWTPTASARDSLTPYAGTSAFVCAENSATPFRTNLCTALPFGEVAATEWTGESSRGWCTTTRSAPHSTASSTTAGAGSTANITRLTSWSGSPHTRPTASHCSAQDGSYQASRSAVTLRTDTAIARTVVGWSRRVPPSDGPRGDTPGPAAATVTRAQPFTAR